jgi:putative intracellular protease/amidase
VKILMVLTSHSQLGDTGKTTGFWLEELAAPYYVFKDAGAEVTLASPKGGQPPCDPKSDAPDAQTDSTKRFRADAVASAALAATRVLATIKMADFDAIFYPGGHGPLWDLVNDPHSIALIQGALGAQKPVGLVCHGPAALKNVNGPDGLPIVKGRRVAGYSNDEELAVGLTNIVPFLVEDMLRAKGGQYSNGPNFEPYTVHDGLLITGQNPASSKYSAEIVLATLNA